MKRICSIIVLLSIGACISGCANNSLAPVGEVINGNANLVDKTEKRSVDVNSNVDNENNKILVDENGYIYCIDVDSSYSGKITATSGDLYKKKHVVVGYENKEDGIPDVTKPIEEVESELVASKNCVEIYQNDVKVGEIIQSETAFNIDRADCAIEEDPYSIGEIDYARYSKEGDAYNVEGKGYSFMISNNDEILSFHIDKDFAERFVGKEKPDVENNKVYYYLNGSYIGWRHFE